MRELRVASRRLWQSPTFTIFAVVTLGLGIGAATAAYSALYALVLQPPGFDAGNVAVVQRVTAIAPNVPAVMSWQEYRDLAEQQRSFSSLAAWAGVRGLVLTAPDEARLVQVEAVTGGYFEMLGVRPALGRLIQPRDDDPAAPAVVVLSESTWRSQYDADPAVIGTTVSLGGQPLTVVGVAPSGFRGITALLVSQNSGWVPIPVLSKLGPTFASFTAAPESRRFLVAGRAAPRVTVENAAVEMKTIGQRFDLTTPLPEPPAGPGVVPGVRPTRAWSAMPADRVSSRLMSGEMGRVILALPALVLLVACTNLTNLVLSRAGARAHELSVRTALGASRARLIREEIGEAAVVAGIGGAIGAVVAHGLLTWTVATLQEPMTSFAPGLVIDWRLRPIVFAAAGAAALLAMLVAGLLPAWQVTRRAPGRALMSDAVSTLPRWRGRSNLIALQTSVSVALFLLTAIAVRFVLTPPDGTPRELLDPGRELQGVALVTVPFGLQFYDDARTRDALGAIVRGVRQVPGVTAVATADAVPSVPTQEGSRVSVRLPGAPNIEPMRGRDPALATPEAAVYRVSPEFFDVLPVEADRGRLFDDRDAGAAPVVVLSARLARRVFGGADPIGRQVTLGLHRSRSGERRRDVDATVIGVTHYESPVDADRQEGLAFVPFSQFPTPSASIVARGPDDDARPLVGAILTAIRRVDRDLAVTAAGRADVMARGPLTFMTYLVTVVAGLATLALVLAMGGLYGVLSDVVMRRMREMGLRIALGAEPGQIQRLVLRSGFRPVVEGLVIGLGSAWVIRQMIQMGFVGTLSGIDLTLVGAAAAPLVVAAAIACYLPARRASRVDPNVVLRNL